MSASIPSRLSDTELVAEVLRLVRSARATTASVVAHLAKRDARRLYLGAGFSSLVTYCTAVLGLSESDTDNRLEAGEATVDDIQLRCRAHNAYEAELFYGPGKVVRGDGVVREPTSFHSCVTEPRTRSGTSSDVWDSAGSFATRKRYDPPGHFACPLASPVQTATPSAATRWGRGARP